MVNLTQPTKMFFKGKVPEEKSLRNHYLNVEACLKSYKEVYYACHETKTYIFTHTGDKNGLIFQAFTDEGFFKALTSKLESLLQLVCCLLCSAVLCQILASLIYFVKYKIKQLFAFGRF